MNKYLLAIPFLYSQVSGQGLVSARGSYQQWLDRLTKTEISFAAQAEKTTTREAFLNNLDKDGVLFVRGKPVNGKSVYEQATPDSSELLAWFPSYAEVSDSGDFGFTTGPYDYYLKRGDEKISTGNFFSIWRKDDSGAYKLWLDGGVTHSKQFHNPLEPRRMQDMVTFQHSKAVINKANVPAEPAQIAFFALVSKNPRHAYERYLSAQAVVVRKDHALTNSKVKNMNLDFGEMLNYSLVPSTLVYNSLKNMYFSHGLVKVKSADGLLSDAGFFVQVWQFQKDGWRLIADVLSLTAKPV
jgi:hypothetical protein